MKISWVDRSLYFKGLLLLIRKDGKIHNEERTMIVHLGKLLGFEKKFCENALKDILDNKHIIDSPPHFSEPQIARCFIRDGLRLSLADNQMHENEILWLKPVAENHGLGDTWYKDAVKAHSNKGRGDLEGSFDAECFEWK